MINQNKRKNQFLFKVFILSCISCLSNASVNLLERFTPLLNFQFMDKLENGNYVYWDSSNILTIRAENISSNIILDTFNFSSHTKIGHEGDYFFDFAMSPDRTLLIGTQFEVICFYSFVDPAYRGCDTITIPIFQVPKSIQFIHQDNKTVIVGFQPQGYAYLNLTVALSFNKTIYIDLLSFNEVFIEYFRIWNQNKILAVTNSSKLYQILTNGTIPYSINQITPASLGTVVKFIKLMGTGYFAALTYPFEVRIFNNSLNLVKTITGQFTDIYQYDFTLFILAANRSIVQIQLLDFNRLDEKTTQTRRFSYNPISLINNIRTLETFDYLAFYHQRWNITTNINCITQYAQCFRCNLTSQLCLICNNGYIINSSNLCEIVCGVGYIQNTDKMSCNLAPPPRPINNTNNTVNNNFNNTNNSTSSNKSDTPQTCIIQNCLKCSKNPSFCDQCEVSYFLQISKCEYVENYQLVKATTQTVGSFLSFPNVRIYLTPLNPFFVLLDDYWYYVYHNREYNIYVNIVFDSIKLISQTKLVPDFIDFSEADRALNVSNILASNYSSYTFQKFVSQQNADNQFLINAYEVYTWNYISGLSLFIFMRLIYIILKAVLDKKTKLKGIVEYFWENSLYKMLIITFIEGNIIFISFNCFLQINSVSFYNGVDRLNALVAYFFLFLAIIFSFCFYVLVYALCKEKQASAFLVYTQYGLKAFIVEGSLAGIKNLVNGFIHAYLLYNYHVQIGSLISLKIVLIVVVVFCKRAFEKKILFWTLIIYILFQLMLDLTLLVENIFDIGMDSIGIVQICFFGIISLSILVLILSTIFYDVKQIIQNFCCCYSNKISPENQQPQQQQAKKKRNRKQIIQFKKSIKKQLIKAEQIAPNQFEQIKMIEKSLKNPSFQQFHQNTQGIVSSNQVMKQFTKKKIYKANFRFSDNRMFQRSQKAINPSIEKKEKQKKNINQIYPENKVNKFRNQIYDVKQY